MTVTKKIGERIAEARRRINISQAELAHRLFVSSQAVGKWERGESMPDITTFIRIAEIAGVDLNYFSDNFVSVADGITVQTEAAKTPESPAGKRKNSLIRDMSNGNWADADFSGLKNLHERFSSSNMQHCMFIGSEMAGLALRNNNVDSCDFRGSDFSGSRFKNSNLADNKFNDCLLNETEFSTSFISGCDFSGADFTGVLVKSGGMEKNKISGAVFSRTSFINTHLADMVFEGTMEDCSFENCAFTRVTFLNATLINTFFKNNRKLKKVKFVDCKADKLTYAFLKSNLADLTGVEIISE